VCRTQRPEAKGQRREARETQTTNLLPLARPEFRIELRGALFRAAQSRQPAEACPLPYEVNGERRVVTMHVAPERDIAPDFRLAVFDATGLGAGGDCQGRASHQWIG
jgi:hypothetical protein